MKLGLLSTHMADEQQPRFVGDLAELGTLQGQTVEYYMYNWEQGVPAVVGEVNDGSITLYRRLRTYTTEDGVRRRDASTMVTVRDGVFDKRALGNPYNKLRVRVLTEEEQAQYQDLPISHDYQPRRDR